MSASGRNKRQSIETLQAKLDSGERGPAPAARDRLLEASREYDLLGNSDSRHEKLLRSWVIMSESTERLCAAVDDKAAAKDVVEWIHATYDNEESNRDYRTALRMFGRVLTAGDDVPEPLSWVPSGTSSDYQPTPSPGDMYQWDEHIQPMLNACENTRDKALIALAWDAGPRAGELETLTVGDVSDHEYGLKVSVDGKRGQRSITLIPSVPHVNRWLADHPAGDDPSAPLWSQLSSCERISYRMLLKALESAADRADMRPPAKVTPTQLRKSSASYLATRGVSQAYLEDHHGWTRGSDKAARYIAVFDDAREREIASAHGVEVEADEPEPTGPVTCPRCDRETPRERSACMWCGQALEPEAAEAMQQFEELLMAAISRFPEDVDNYIDFKAVYDEFPPLRDLVIEVAGEEFSHGDQPSE